MNSLDEYILMALFVLLLHFIACRRNLEGLNAKNINCVLEERVHSAAIYKFQESLDVKVCRPRVYIYIRQLSSFRAPLLWFIDETVATCHIQCTFL